MRALTVILMLAAMPRGASAQTEGDGAMLPDTLSTDSQEARKRLIPKRQPRMAAERTFTLEGDSAAITADTLATALQRADSLAIADSDSLWTWGSPLAADSLHNDSLLFSPLTADSLAADTLLAGKKGKRHREKRDWDTWKPDPQRALWLALVIPGGGQIYNRKYWKLPIVYGGIMGCIYAMRWNNMMYKDYSQAYLDIMDSDPTTESYNEFLHLGTTITSSNEDQYKTIFKKRKDKYRRWRDLAVFCLIGVYALSVIDAYIDAQLSEFDISPDLSLRVEPGFIDTGTGGNLLEASSIGVNVGIDF